LSAKHSPEGERGEHPNGKRFNEKQTMTPEQTALIASESIKGSTTREIAAIIGCNQSSIVRTINKPDIRAKIEREANEIISRGLLPARRTLTRLAALGSVKCQDKDMLKLSLDASKHITAIAGLSGNSQSTIINNLIQINQAPEAAKEVAGLTSFIEAQWQQIEEKSNEGTSIATPHTEVAESVHAVNIPMPDPVGRKVRTPSKAVKGVSLGVRKRKRDSETV
jgi:thiamine kinase-like enzyme